jgi:hypothetical protein
VFMQSSRMGNSFSSSYTWMTSYFLVVMLICYWRQRSVLSSNFDMKHLGEASFVLGIEVHRNGRKGVLGISQKTY